MESAVEITVLERELAIAASPETVWAFLTDPEKAQIWWGTYGRFDLRAGGAYEMAVTPGSIAQGTFVEIDPPNRLVFTWGWESGGAGPDLVPVGSSTVEIDLRATEEGTLVRLVHRGLPGAAMVESHAMGWDHYLGRLAVAAPGGDPGPDEWRRAE